MGCARLQYPDEWSILKDEDECCTLVKKLIEDTREMAARHFQELHNSSVNQPWREWHDFIWDPEEPLPAELMSNHMFRGYLEDELTDFVQSDGEALHQEIKDNNRLNGVTYMRLWIHAYATRAWAHLLMQQTAAASTKLADSDCSVHFLVARTDLNGDSLPSWASITSSENAGFFIHKGSWPKEILRRGRFFNSGRLAVMDGPGV